MPSKKKTVVEEITKRGAEALEALRNLIREGNVRKVVVRNGARKVVATFPLYAGMAGVLLAPVLSAVGALVAVTGDCTISVEKKK
jgi:hypothetical protein